MNIARTIAQGILTASLLTLCTAVGAQTTGPDQSSTAQLQEIVVTAEKRSTTTQEIAGSIAAVSNDTLLKQNILDAAGLNDLISNTQFYNITNETQVAIRGIGSNFFDQRADPATAVSLDGLYFAKPSSNNGTFYDIDRIEVLKGPQGTLYGRNSAAGAVNIITKQPENVYDAGGQVTAGNYGLFSSQGFFNIPITDELAFRAAFQSVRHDGYVAGYYDDADDIAGRASILWHPGDNLKVFGEVDYFHSGGNGSVFISAPVSARPGSSPWSLFFPANGPLFPEATAPNDGHNAQKNLSAQLHVDYDMNWATLTSITGYVEQITAKFQPMGPYGTLDVDEGTHQTTEEFRLASDSRANAAGKFEWVAGAFLFKENDNFTLTVANGFPFGDVGENYPTLTARSYSAFGQSTYAILDHLRLTGGVRYTHDEKTEDGFSVLSESGIFPNGSFHDTGDVTFSNTSYRAGVEGDLAKDHLLYANVSTGYIAGGLNAGSTTTANPPPGTLPASFPAETLRAYEVGSKNLFWDRRIQLNADFYYYDFKHYQAMVLGISNEGAFQSAITDGGNVKTYGFEIDSKWMLTENDRFDISGVAARGTFKTLILPQLGAPPEDLSGLDLINLPKYQAYLGYSHTFRLPNQSTVEAGVHSHVSSSFLSSITTSAFAHQPSYSITGLNLTFTSADTKWSVTAFVDNVENSAVVPYTAQLPSENLGSIEPPRTFGITLRAKL